MKCSKDHHSQAKWCIKLNSAIPWVDVWESVHNFLSLNDIKSVIWQQIHLNFYTQYTYNKWHKNKENCPLCNTLPHDIYHIILNCDMVNELHPNAVSDEEKVFGLITKNKSPGILLRNWLTYLLRFCITQLEREAHYSSYDIRNKMKIKMMHEIEERVQLKYFQYAKENNLVKFQKIFCHANVLCTTNEEEEYTINVIFA